MRMFGRRKEKPMNEQEAKECRNENIRKDNMAGHKDIHTNYGWISPDGRYFFCEHRGHVDLASRICFGLVDTVNPELYLEEHGWCKIYKPFSGGLYEVYVNHACPITNEQIETLVAMGLNKQVSRRLNMQIERK